MLDALLNILILSLIIGFGVRGVLWLDSVKQNREALRKVREIEQQQAKLGKEGPWGVSLFGRYPKHYAVLTRGGVLCSEYGLYPLTSDEMELLRALARCNVNREEQLTYKKLPFSRKQQGMVVYFKKEDSKFWGSTRLPRLKTRLDDLLWIVECSMTEQKVRGMKPTQLAYYK